MIFQEAMSSQSVFMRRGAAMSTRCPPRLLALAVSDSDVWVRRYAVHNAKCPVWALLEATKDVDEYVRNAANRALDRIREQLRD